MLQAWCLLNVPEKYSRSYFMFPVYLRHKQVKEPREQEEKHFVGSSALHSGLLKELCQSARILI